MGFYFDGFQYPAEGFSANLIHPVPGAWGRNGSTNVRLAKIDQVTLRSALKMAWRNVAPKSLAD